MRWGRISLCFFLLPTYVLDEKKSKLKKMVDLGCGILIEVFNRPAVDFIVTAPEATVGGARRHPNINYQILIQIQNCSATLQPAG